MENNYNFLVEKQNSFNTKLKAPYLIPTIFHLYNTLLLCHGLNMYFVITDGLLYTFTY